MVLLNLLWEVMRKSDPKYHAISKKEGETDEEREKIIFKEMRKTIKNKEEDF